MECIECGSIVLGFDGTAIGDIEKIGYPVDCVKFLADGIIKYTVSCDLYFNDNLVLYFSAKRARFLVRFADCVGDFDQILWDCGLGLFLFFEGSMAFCGIFIVLVGGLGAIAIDVGRNDLWLGLLWGLVGDPSA